METSAQADVIYTPSCTVLLSIVGQADTPLYLLPIHFVPYAALLCGLTVVAGVDGYGHK